MSKTFEERTVETKGKGGTKKYVLKLLKSSKSNGGYYWVYISKYQKYEYFDSFEYHTGITMKELLENEEKVKEGWKIPAWEEYLKFPQKVKDEVIDIFKTNERTRIQFLVSGLE